jgi:hypothetical protein
MDPGPTGRRAGVGGGVLPREVIRHSFGAFHRGRAALRRLQTCRAGPGAHRGVPVAEEPPYEGVRVRGLRGRGARGGQPTPSPGARGVAALARGGRTRRLG